MPDETLDLGSDERRVDRLGHPEREFAPPRRGQVATTPGDSIGTEPAYETSIVSAATTNTQVRHFGAIRSAPSMRTTSPLM